jgi:hypothetical protein
MTAAGSAPLLRDCSDTTELSAPRTSSKTEQINDRMDGSGRLDVALDGTRRLDETMLTLSGRLDLALDGTGRLDETMLTLSGRLDLDGTGRLDGRLDEASATGHLDDGDATTTTRRWNEPDEEVPDAAKWQSCFLAPSASTVIHAQGRLESTDSAEATSQSTSQPLLRHVETVGQDGGNPPSHNSDFYITHPERDDIDLLPSKAMLKTAILGKHPIVLKNTMTMMMHMSYDEDELYEEGDYYDDEDQLDGLGLECDADELGGGDTDSQ